MNMRAMRFAIAAAAGLALLAAATPAGAFGLTDVDQEYLSAQGVEREQARLHAVINDAATAGDPLARASAVTKALEEFRERQAWEETHPGELWGVRRR
jgi:hypothetical protein